MRLNSISKEDMLLRSPRILASSTASTAFLMTTLRLVPTERYSVWCMEEQAPLPEPGTIRHGVRVVKAYRLPSPCENGIFVVSTGSVVDFSGDAIVNAANRGCRGGGGVDGAITARGGAAMAKERLALPILEGTRMDRCATGDAKITTGGDLPAARCIHSVGPNYHMYRGLGGSLAQADELLTSAYRRSMAVARDSGEVRTLGFALLSAGVFRGPRSLREVLERGVRGVVAEATDKDAPFTALKEVHLVAFTNEEVEQLLAVTDEVFLGIESKEGGGLGNISSERMSQIWLDAAEQ
jgi:O-acetyl-ADP-ribose deacetylase (regulator of RNase III)